MYVGSTSTYRPSYICRLYICSSSMYGSLQSSALDPLHPGLLVGVTYVAPRAERVGLACQTPSYLSAPWRLTLYSLSKCTVFHSPTPPTPNCGNTGTMCTMNKESTEFTSCKTWSTQPHGVYITFSLTLNTNCLCTNSANVLVLLSSYSPPPPQPQRRRMSACRMVQHAI